jgi:YkoY family integral membrane protein
MLHQTFSLIDLPRLLLLVLLECALSADNALIIAAIIKPLPDHHKNKALWIGVSSALFLRLGAIFSLAYFIHFFWIQLLGAAYLLYIAILYHMKYAVHYPYKARSESLWKVIVRLELTDLVFALDSIIAALGITKISIVPGALPPSKLWVVYMGGVIGLILMRFAAKILSTLMKKFANLEKTSHYLIGWVALKLGFQSIYEYYVHPPHPYAAFYIELVFWLVSLLLLIYGILPKKEKR